MYIWQKSFITTSTLILTGGSAAGFAIFVAVVSWISSQLQIVSLGVSDIVLHSLYGMALSVLSQ